MKRFTYEVGRAEHEVLEKGVYSSSLRDLANQGAITRLEGSSWKGFDQRPDREKTESRDGQSEPQEKRTREAISRGNV